MFLVDNLSIKNYSFCIKHISNKNLNAHFPKLPHEVQNNKSQLPHETVQIAVHTYPFTSFRIKLRTNYMRARFEHTKLEDVIAGVRLRTTTGINVLLNVLSECVYFGAITHLACLDP